jgi:hypothetical protein
MIFGLLSGIKIRNQLQVSTVQRLPTQHQAMQKLIALVMQLQRNVLLNQHQLEGQEDSKIKPQQLPQVKHLIK